VQTDVDGSHGYGKFSIAADGTWTYVMTGAHDEFKAGHDYTDSITVTTADGTTKVITVTIHGTNDAAVITAGGNTGSVTEDSASNPIQGDVNNTDVDNDADLWTATTISGQNHYGALTMDASGKWTYTLDNGNAAVDALNVGGHLTDTFTVTTADGQDEVITVTINGANDAAVITGSSSQQLTESNSPLNTGGKLSASDVDSSANFVPQSNVAGNNNYGTFTILADGTWTYAMNGAHNEFVGGQDYTDSITVATADGTTQVITVTIHGTNDAAVITGTSSQSLTETDAAQSTGGKLNATDVDSSALFTAQSNANGSNGYGKFTIQTDGTWTYTMNNAHNEFAAGQDYTDSITVATADGTTQVLTVTMHGSNDAAVITGTSSQSLTETDTAQSTGGKLNATDIDSSPLFTAQSNVAGSNGYGKFTIQADGTWTYTMNSAHNEFVGGQNYTDSITVATADGTTQVLTVTIQGTNDAAVIGGTSTGSVTEDATQTASGALTINDPEGQNSFAVHNSGNPIVGTYGSLTIDASGNWVYTLNNSANNVQALGSTDHVHDQIHVTSADGTDQIIDITVNGANDAPTTPTFVASASATTDGTSLDLGKFLSTDLDTEDSVSYSMTNTMSLGTWSVNSSTGELTATGVSANTGGITGNITVTATDGHSAGVSQTFSVWIGRDGSGGPSNDSITVTGSNPSIVDGRAGNDTITGSTGTDYVYGGAGNDTVKGLGGADWLSGGTGDDHFRFEAVSDSKQSAFDTILDFQHGTGGSGHDFIDFATALGLTATGTTSGGNLAAHTVAWQSDGNGNMLVYANTGSATESVANGTHIIEIELIGVNTLTASDFNLLA
jgi:VCBS repeat-containing protein